MAKSSNSGTKSRTIIFNQLGIFMPTEEELLDNPLYISWYLLTFKSHPEAQIMKESFVAPAALIIAGPISSQIRQFLHVDMLNRQYTFASKQTFMRTYMKFEFL